MKAKALRSGILILVLGIAGLVGSSAALAQGRPYHLPAPGEWEYQPLFPVGMQPRGPLAYSWEVGKHRTQKFGDYTVPPRSKEVMKLLKEKEKADKKQNSNHK